LSARLSRAGAPLLAAFFPDNCRVCDSPLDVHNRVPVCSKCLNEPEPLAAEIFCAQCRTAFENPRRLDEAGLCESCRSGATHYRAAYSYGHYDGALSALIHLMKYDGVRSLAPHFGRWLAQALPRDQRFDAIVPVPLHWLRYLRRGFNQSELLARALSERTGLPVISGAVRRIRATPRQALLDHDGRRRNVRGAFRVTRPEAIEGRRLLLLDDVLTTGATLNACTHTLIQAGAAHVSILTLARVDNRPSSRELPAALEPTGHLHRGANA
jgi:ComF family protein